MLKIQKHKPHQQIQRKIKYITQSINQSIHQLSINLSKKREIKKKKRKERGKEIAAINLFFSFLYIYRRTTAGDKIKPTYSSFYQYIFENITNLKFKNR